jgi:ABC-type glycerol-3-phosphate transport system substrate-binding protein
MAASTAVPAIREAKRNAHSNAEAFSFHYNLATGEPRLATPGFVHALKIWQRLQGYRAPAQGGSPPESFARGETVLCLADGFWINRFQKSPAHPPFGIARIPGSQVVFNFQTGEKQVVPGHNYVPYLGRGSWLGVIPNTSAHSTAALALLSNLCSPEVSRQIVMEPEWGGGAIRRSQLSEKGWSTFRLDPGLTDTLVESLKQTLLHPGLSNPVTCLRLPTERAHTQILAAELRAALLKGKEAASALKAAAAGWKALDDQHPGTIRANYAFSLNLLPP